MLSNEKQLSNSVVRTLASYLPPGWNAEMALSPRDMPFEGFLTVVSPAGVRSRFAFETKARVEPRDVDRFHAIDSQLKQGEKLLIVTHHIGSRSRELLRRYDISYMDPTGNIRLSSDSLLVDRLGADKSPHKNVDTIPRTTLRGPITGRIVRYLCERCPPFKVRHIATETAVHPGNVSRILKLIERERFIQRDLTGAVISVEWEELIQRWSVDLKKNRRSETFLEPHGLETITERVSRWKIPYAVTGSFASEKIVPTIKPLTIDLYVNDIEEARGALFLRRSEHVGNVRLIEAFDRVVFERTATRDGLTISSPIQIAADLRTLPTRSLDEYTELIKWMKRNESDWRY